MINLERLLRVPRVDADHPFDISADGATAAFSWNLSGRWALYALQIGDSKALRLLLPGAGSRFTPKYSPVNPNTIACLADFDGSENLHLLLLDFASASSQDLTPGDTLQSGFAWSPDGRQIAFISNRSGCFDVYILDLETRQQRLLYASGHPAMDVTWSAADWLAITTENNGQDDCIQLVQANNGETITLLENGHVLDASEPSWSPDGSRLAFCGAHGEYNQLGVFDMRSRQISWLTDSRGSKSGPAWDAQGARLVFLHQSGAANQLVILDVSSRSIQSTFCVERGMHVTPRFSPDGENLLFIFENPQNPPELWGLCLSSGQFQRLTNSMPPEINNNELIMPFEILYPGLDDVQVPALLYRSDKSPSPAIVNIHGGPTWSYSLSWNPFMAHLASRGWVVLAPNYRGSTGYGRQWQTANRYDMGGCDTRDVAAGALYLNHAGLADPARVAVTGRSHGGYLTMTCLTMYPELWAAGSAEAPFFNWFTSHYASRDDLQHWNIENMGDPLSHAALWRERSPYYFLEQLRAPVQIICGELDPRCPVVDSIAARDRLLLLGKQMEFLLYADEGHSFLKMENIIQAETRRVDFLARWVESDQV